ncbi:Fanconi anemia group I protein homolog isoform X1 [Spodoptera frugiperda]|uniref:Fanconi anemia group I protein homolog isoform X1 n=1 Tax=Spodoptera frugiperda TaxID=7108 RepID=A0A9R0F3L4_SPOFR|nr:Fanconi anemia group I protein homolog isoform X1 [Spodoptera frugiperda]
MEYDKLISTIKEYGRLAHPRVELYEFCRQHVEQILKFVPQTVLCRDFGDAINCILNGFPDNSDANSKIKSQIVDLILQTLRKESVSLTHCSEMCGRICVEFPKLPVDDIVRWVNESIESIIQDNDVNITWKYVIPECFNALSEHETIKHCGSDLTVAEFKDQCVQTLYQYKWLEKQLVPMAAMFKYIQLSRNDHKKFVNKFCSYINDLAPDDIPPLIHQMLRLCRLYDFDIVLAHLNHYFSVRLYAKLEPPPQDSESTTIDLDDIASHSAEDISRCLSTCIFHFTRGAADPEIIRKHLKNWPKTQLLRSPFIIDLAMAMSEKGGDFKTVCLNLVKSAIEQRSMDEFRARESAWVRAVLPPDVDIVSLLKVLTTESPAHEKPTYIGAIQGCVYTQSQSQYEWFINHRTSIKNHRQLTVAGLINLAFLLLSVSRVKPLASTCWSHGKLILVRLSKAQPETAPFILQQLTDKLCTETALRQYAECLYVLCKLTPVSVERCPQLSMILENCQPSPAGYKAHAAILDAVHPLFNFSTRIRDTLVLVCRKGLYSRDSQHRCLALSGFLSVLRNVRVNAPSSSSQTCSDLHSGHSYLTQLTVDLHTTQNGAAVTSRVRNEGMCMEVVSILRRCLVQDALVKQLLYSQLYDCAKDKPMLHETILELFHDHLVKYLPEDVTAGSLLIDKCVQVNGVNVVLTEPIGQLLFAVAQFLQTTEIEDLEDILSSQVVETGHAYLKSKLNRVMQQLCDADSFFDIDMEEANLSDLTPESKAKSLKVQQTLHCYEALIAHTVMQWTLTSEDTATKLYKLFKACNQLLEQTKVLPKSSKKGNKSLNETRETVKSQKSQKSQKEKGKGPVKLSNLVKDKAGPFKPLPCLWNPGFCQKIIELLYSDEVSWASLEQRNQIRARRDFHMWALRSVQSVLLTDNIDKKDVATNVVRIATLLYNKAVVRFQNMCGFDDQVALTCLEVFKTCLTLLFSPLYMLKMDCFLSIITGTNESASECLASILDNVHTALQHIEADSVPDERDLVVKKQLQLLIQIAAMLLETPTASCPLKTRVLVKLEDYIRTSTQDCVSLVGPVLTAGCSELQEAALLDELLVKLATVLGRIDEEDTSAGEETENFHGIDSRTGHAVLVTICGQLAARARGLEHLLARARDLAAAAALAVHSAEQRIMRDLTEIYKSVVLQLCQMTSWTAGCCKLRCSLGAASERVLAAAVRLYSMLAALVKQIDPVMAQTVRFERLLKLCGKKLSSVTDNLITYLEASQNKETATKLLRETKLIPRLVLEAELFSKRLILLSTKAKLNWQQYLSLGTARDFRIKAPVLQEVLNAQEQADETRDEGEADINDAETDITEAASDAEQEERSDEEASTRKRRRVS